MSIQSWIQEFYPTPVEELETHKRTPVELVEHSLTKWIGLRPENTTRHSVYLKRDGAQPAIMGCGKDKYGFTPQWSVNSGSCSLCDRYTYQYINKGTDTEERIPDCLGCPLYAVRGNRRCDASMGGEPHSPYTFACLGNPEPMIEWLEKALEYAKAKEAEAAAK